MSYRKANGSSVKISNIQSIVSNKRERDNYTFTYDELGNGYYTMDGKRLSVKEFNSLFPVDGIPIMEKGANPDGTRI